MLIDQWVGGIDLFDPRQRLRIPQENYDRVQWREGWFERFSIS